LGTSNGVAESRGKLHANLLLHPLNAAGYWVYGPLAVGEDGIWRQRVYFGQLNGPSEDFQLIAIVTREPLDAEGSGGGKPEYTSIPPHIAISSTPVVTRN
jgi:hypothetical protein